jgi:lysophospholipase L1-like esterase
MGEKLLFLNRFKLTNTGPMKKSFKYLNLFLLSLSFLVPLTSQAGTTQIMAFGDSITQGVNYIMSPGAGRRVGGYEPHLEYLFSLVGREAYVYNWGLGGETTQQALDGGKIVCEIEFDPITGEDVETCGFVESRTLGSALAKQGSANYFLLMEGTNDYFSSITPWNTATYLGRMMDAARTANMEPIVATITPDQRGIDKEIEYRNSLIKIKANEKGVAVVDMYNGLLGNWSAYVSSDNLHPNTYGYKAMARQWFVPFYNIQLTTGTAEAFQDSPKSMTAVLNGSAKANGKVFEVEFQYGLDSSMTETVPASPDKGDASGGLVVSAEIGGLQFETQYYYRMVSYLDGMTFYGDIKEFTTPERFVSMGWLILLFNDDTPVGI